MAVTTKVPGQLSLKLLGGVTLDWANDEIRVALLTTAGLSAFDQDAHETIAELAAAEAAWEASGTNYTTGGQALGTKTTNYDSGNNYMQFRAAPSVWSNATISAYGAVVFKYAAGVAANQVILTVVDFGGVVSSSSGDYTITWDATQGVIRTVAT